MIWSTEVAYRAPEPRSDLVFRVELLEYYHILNTWIAEAWFEKRSQEANVCSVLGRAWTYVSTQFVRRSKLHHQACTRISVVRNPMWHTVWGLHDVRGEQLAGLSAVPHVGCASLPPIKRFGGAYPAPVCSRYSGFPDVMDVTCLGP